MLRISSRRASSSTRSRRGSTSARSSTCSPASPTSSAAATRSSSRSTRRTSTARRSARARRRLGVRHRRCGSAPRIPITERTRARVLFCRTLPRYEMLDVRLSDARQRGSASRPPSSSIPATCSSSRATLAGKVVDIETRVVRLDPAPYARMRIGGEITELAEKDRRLIADMAQRMPKAGRRRSGETAPRPRRDAPVATIPLTGIPTPAADTCRAGVYARRATDSEGGLSVRASPINGAASPRDCSSAQWSSASSCWAGCTSSRRSRESRSRCSSSSAAADKSAIHRPLT